MNPDDTYRPTLMTDAEADAQRNREYVTGLAAGNDLGGFDILPGGDVILRVDTGEGFAVYVKITGQDIAGIAEASANKRGPVRTRANMRRRTPHADAVFPGNPAIRTASQLGAQHRAAGTHPYGDRASAGTYVALMAALGETSPATDANLPHRLHLLDAYLLALGATTTPVRVGL